MHKLAIITLTCLLSFSLKAHDFYFAFAEMEINPFTGAIETTLMVTTHDMEKALTETNIEVRELETDLMDSLVQLSVENYINKHFVLTTGDFQSNFHIEGYETFLNGLTYFYLLSDGKAEVVSYKVKFDLMMDIFPEQQNKLTLYYRDRSYTLSFISNESYKQLNINKE